MDDYLRILFLLFLVAINIVMIKKENKKFDFIDVDIVDNKANWVYNNNLYYANIIDGKIDKKDIRKVSL